MKIAIHHRPDSFSERWIKYCQKNLIDYKIVNAFDNDIIQQVSGCDAFMWHHHHGHFKDVLTAKRILFALQQAGILVFPNFNTGWHFDDKVAQKYLLEAIDAPFVPSYVFYDKEEAMSWAKTTTYPKVFKLKGGSGAKNVKLVKDYQEAKKLINQAFNRGFPQFDGIGNFKESFNKFKYDNGSLGSVIKSTARLIIEPEYSKLQNPEKGYIYFQDFVPNNSFDVRVIVTGDRAYATRRYVRKNDFRASGSGLKDHSKEAVDIACIKNAFLVKNKLDVQTISYDFVFDANNNPLIIEISYGFPTDWADTSPGYWDSKLEWHQGSIVPQYWMIENLIKEIEQSKSQLT